MPAGEYDIEVIAEGFVSQTVTGVDVVGGSTVTQDFELRLLAPCLSAVPSELEKTLVVDQIGTETLTIIILVRLMQILSSSKLGWDYFNFVK